MAAYKCDESVDVCQFSLVVSGLQTFTRYRLTDNSTQGFIYSIINGTITPAVSTDPCAIVLNAVMATLLMESHTVPSSL